MNKILLAIGDYSLTRQFSSFLSDDYAIDAFSSEVDVLNSLQNNDYDFVLIDLSPSKLDGSAILNYLEESKKILNQPVSVIIEAENLQRELSLFNKGCSEIFKPPFDSIITRKRIQNVIDIFTLKKNVKDYEKKLLSDPMTGLLNRDGFELNVRKLLKVRQPGAFVMCDLDGLKYINDNYSHQVGDSVIQGLGKTLAATMPDRAFKAHVSGDEFCVFIPDISGEEEVSDYCKKFQKTLLTKVLLPDLSRPVTASIGIAVFPDVGTTYEVLHSKSDHAMLYVKNHGKNSFKFHAPRDDREELLKGRQECTNTPVDLMLKERSGEEIQTWLKFGEFRIVYITYKKYSSELIRAQLCQLNIVDLKNPENPDSKKVMSLNEKITTFIREALFQGIFSWYSINQLLILSIKKETLPRGIERLKKELASEMQALQLDIVLVDGGVKKD